jgi:hypothetical protein
MGNQAFDRAFEVAYLCINSFRIIFSHLITLLMNKVTLLYTIALLHASVRRYFGQRPCFFRCVKPFGIFIVLVWGATARLSAQTLVGMNMGFPINTRYYVGPDGRENTDFFRPRVGGYGGIVLQHRFHRRFILRAEVSRQDLPYRMNYVFNPVYLHMGLFPSFGVCEHFWVEAGIARNIARELEVLYEKGPFWQGYVGARIPFSKKGSWSFTTRYYRLLTPTYTEDIGIGTRTYWNKGFSFGIMYLLTKYPLIKKNDRLKKSKK